MSYPNLFDLSGKTAIVTGGASGLGLSIAEALVENGAHVALFDLDQHGLEEAAHRLRRAGADVLNKTVDVADRDQRNQKPDAHSELSGSNSR
jgi:NAD(P)-dependent dehydrogenase (short-subunit alcohol dehydrogenase family)